MVAWDKLGGMLAAHKQQQAIKIKSNVGTMSENYYETAYAHSEKYTSHTSVRDWRVAWGVSTSPWGKGWLYCLQRALYLPFTVLGFKIKLFWSEIGAYRLQALKTVTAPPYLSSEVMSNWQNMPCKESVTWKPYNLQSSCHRCFWQDFIGLLPWIVLSAEV